MTSSTTSTTSTSSTPLTCLGDDAEAGWLLGRLARWAGSSEIGTDQADRERMRNVSAQSFTAIDALLLTDCSPVSESLTRCCGERTCRR